MPPAKKKPETDDDLTAILKKMVELAKEGDVPAARLVLQYTLGKPVSQPHPDRIDRDEMAACSERHRSPIVLQCVDDYLAGKRAPLELLHTHASVFEGGLTLKTDVT